METINGYKIDRNGLFLLLVDITLTIDQIKKYLTKYISGDLLLKSNQNNIIICFTKIDYLTAIEYISKCNDIKKIINEKYLYYISSKDDSTIKNIKDRIVAHYVNNSLLSPFINFFKIL